MVDQPPIPSGSGAGARAAGNGEPITLAVDQQLRRSLADVLAPGEVVSGRVVQALGGDQYLFSLRGRNLIASSQVPLAADSVVRIQVLAAGNDQLSLRLLGGASGDSAQTTDPLTRMQALGLPADQLGSMVLSAFEDAGAPLGRSQVLAALAALQQAGADPAVSSPAATPPQLAGALAALAREGLPATPATIALAVRALDQALPDPGSSLVQLQQTAAAASSDGQPASAVPGPQPTADDPAQPASTPAGASPTLSAPVAPGPAAAPAPAPGAATSPASPGPAAAGVSAPSADAVPAATLPVAAGAQTASSAGIGGGAAPSAAGASSAGAVAASAGVPPTSGPVSQTTLPSATTAAADVGAEQPSAVLDASASAAATVAQRAAGIPLQTAGTVAGDLALRAVLGMSLPDATTDGAPAVLVALALAGVRSSDAAGGAAHAAPTLLKQLAAAGEAAAVRGDPTPAQLAERGAVPSGMGEALVRAVREGAAQSVVKPEALVDYDLVVGLPLQDQGRPTPARLAVAERRTAAGNATYLRVDAELSHLGPVSVRLSGIEGGALAITLLADGNGGLALADALPGLADSLHELGIVAGLRVASLGEDPAADVGGSEGTGGSGG